MFFLTSFLAFQSSENFWPCIWQFTLTADCTVVLKASTGPAGMIFFVITMFLFQQFCIFSYWIFLSYNCLFLLYVSNSLTYLYIYLKLHYTYKIILIQLKFPFCLFHCSAFSWIGCSVYFLSVTWLCSSDVT